MMPALRRVFFLGRETFRQASHSRMSWVLLGVSAIVVVLFAGITMDPGPPLRVEGENELFGGDGEPLSGPNPRPGFVRLGYGMIRLPLFRDVPEMIEFLQSVLATSITSPLGILVLLAATAGLLPEWFRSGSGTWVLSRPVPRWEVILGQYLGAVGFAAYQTGILVVGSSLALGLRTGYWHAAFLTTWPIVVLEFALVYGVTVWIGTWTRSAGVCLVGSFLVWCLCLAVNQAADTLRSGHLEHAPAPGSQVMNQGSRGAAVLIQAAYWLLPKPLDLTQAHAAWIGADRHLADPTASGGARQPGRPELAYSVLSSLVSMGALLVFAQRMLRTQDVDRPALV
jgi:hypothetical protein